MISNDALNLGGLTFTSLFTEVDITGILGLASAAPVYTCFLSSIWANDMNSVLGQPFKRDIPSEEEAKKLILLFSRHEDGGNGYDLVELLIDETEELINEVQQVVGAGEGVFNATGSGSVFSRLNVQHLLAVARDAPVYSNGLSAAIETALSEYRETLSLDMTVSSINDLGGQEQIQSQSQSAISSSATSSISEALTLVEPVTTISTTNTYITVFTISTNYRDGTATVPTSMVTTSTFTIIKPIRTVHSTRSILIESADSRMALMATSDSKHIARGNLHGDGPLGCRRYSHRFRSYCNRRSSHKANGSTDYSWGYYLRPRLLVSRPYTWTTKPQYSLPPLPPLFVPPFSISLQLHLIPLVRLLEWPISLRCRLSLPVFSVLRSKQ